MSVSLFLVYEMKVHGENHRPSANSVVFGWLLMFLSLSAISDIMTTNLNME